MESPKSGYRERNVAVAMILAAILPYIGAGHLYLGAVSRALIFIGAIWGLVGLWMLSLLFSLIVINDTFSAFFLFLAFASIAAIVGTWIWEIIDARKVCERLNAQNGGRKT